MNDPIDNETVSRARRIAMLVTGFICQTLSEAEREELDNWIGESDDNMLLFEQLTDSQRMTADLLWMQQLDTDGRLKILKRQLAFTPKVRRLQRFWQYAAAASIVLLVALAAFYVSYLTNKPLPPLSQLHKQDVEPGSDKAQLILSNGKTILLEDAANGVIANTTGGSVIKKDGLVEFATSDSQSQPGSLLYNEVRTPRGGSYSVSLPDGTHVWMNAASSVKFPTLFANAERRISVSGEVYIEVVKSAIPFRVEIDNTVIEVLGTHFNIKAYQDETALETTLLEGSIKIVQRKDEHLLKPGQQAKINKQGALTIIDGIDTAEMIAWKNGFFQFNNADLPTLMQQVARWYDVEVKYEAAIPAIRTTGKAPRNISLDNLLKILSISGVHYRIDNKRLTIQP